MLTSFLHEVPGNLLQLRQSDWTREYPEVPTTVLWYYWVILFKNNNIPENNAIWCCDLAMILLAKNSTIIEIKLNTVLLLIAIVMKGDTAKNEKVIKQYTIHLLTTHWPTPRQSLCNHQPPLTISHQLELHPCLFLALYNVPGAFWTVQLILTFLLNTGHKYQHLSSIS